MTHVYTEQYGTARLVNRNELELERYVDAADTILPFYRIPLTGEHLAAWVVNTMLQEGRTCKRLVNGITAGVRRATRKDSKLVYYCIAEANSAVIIIREGKERTMTFEGLKDNQADEEHFILYITGLIQ